MLTLAFCGGYVGFFQPDTLIFQCVKLQASSIIEADFRIGVGVVRGHI